MGKLDLAATTFYNGMVAVMIGNGDGTFKPAVYYPAGGNETDSSLVTVDLRGNGTLDLVVTNSLNAKVEVLLGNGDGTFGPATAYPTVANPFFIAAGDFTNSGHAGIVALTRGSRHSPAPALSTQTPLPLNSPFHSNLLSLISPGVPTSNQFAISSK